MSSVLRGCAAAAPGDATISTVIAIVIAANDRIQRHDTERGPDPVVRDRGGGCKLTRMLKRPAACLLAALVSATFVVTAARPPQLTAASRLPSRLADQEFWALAADLSE